MSLNGGSMDSFVDYWHQVKQKTQNQCYFYYRNHSQWQGVSIDEFIRRVELLKQYFQSELKIMGRRLAIMADNCVDWDIIQFAALLSGGTVLGIPTNESRKNIVSYHNLTQFDILVVDNINRLQNIPTTVNRSLKNILTFDQLHKPKKQIKKTQLNIHSHDLALIVFTSGTTGTPKALAFTHKQLVLAIETLANHFSFLESNRILAWLPMYNTFQRMTNFVTLFLNGQIYYLEDPKNVSQSILEVKPQVFQTVPRFFEKVYDHLNPILNKWPVKLAANIGFKKLINVYINKIIFGGKLKYLISGSALLHPDYAHFFENLGFKIINAYGTSECLIPLCTSSVVDKCVGQVGRPLPNIEIQQSTRGEILLKSEALAKQIINNNLESLPLDDNGYYHTGDLAKTNLMGEFFLKGRLAHYFKTSTGKRVQPESIEQEILKISGVEHALVFGEGQKYLSVLLDINRKVWPQPDNQLLEQLSHEISKLDLPLGLKPVDIYLSPNSFSWETGELTLNMKMRRTHILERHIKPLSIIKSNTN
ncbi:MAG: AMP-binding protein [Bdellovibrionales bacterium]|nr:AMP-binding protein [Bdellovibrionales bacterium]